MGTNFTDNETKFKSSNIQSNWDGIRSLSSNTNQIITNPKAQVKSRLEKSIPSLFLALTNKLSNSAFEPMTNPWLVVAACRLYQSLQNKYITKNSIITQNF